MKGNIVVGQSGGPTAVINSSVAGVYSAAKSLGIGKVYGMVHGIQGFLKDNLCDLDDSIKGAMDIELLKRTPSAFLGSCRYKLPKIEGNEDLYESIFNVMEKHNIECMFYCGGNDSMDTVKMLSEYALAHNKDQRFVGIPKTIDNDLPVTDHCPGYGSAAKYIATSLKEIIRDNDSFGRERVTVCIVEIMGRNAGWLTAAAALAKDEDCVGVDAIYLPEVVFDLDRFVENIKELEEKRGSIVVCVSEGIKLEDGRYVCELGNDNVEVDAFGHKQMSGTASYLCQVLEDRLGLRTRAIEFSTLQRSASHLSSLTDIEEAFQVGHDAVLAAFDGKSGVMMTIDRISNDPYQFATKPYDVAQIANVERSVPNEWITSDGCGLTEEFIDYARPLIMGELLPYYVNGTPRHLIRK